MNRRNLAAAWVALQVCFFIGWAALEESRLRTGASILVKTAPVDPRDLLRGQYLALSYEFSRPRHLIPEYREAREGETVWVVLRPEGVFHQPESYHAERPKRFEGGRIVVQGRREGWRVVYGIEKYFVPEGSETPAPARTTVRLRVGRDGDARIEQVLVDGKPWP
jgi:uncharacterized membrane-anchored protein